MKGLKLEHARAGHLACSYILSTVLLITLFHYGYSKSYAVSVEAKTVDHAELIEALAEDAVEVVSEVDLEVESREQAQPEVAQTKYSIPDTFVHPSTGNLMRYTGGKTLERTRKITYGEAGALNRAASPDADGFMKLDDRYLIAVGSRFGTTIGQYIDLVLANGTVIPCIMGDLKADCDTDLTHTFTYKSACCSEFIIDEHAIRADIYERGNASLKEAAWNSPVVTIIVYEQYHQEAQ